MSQAGPGLSPLSIFVLGAAEKGQVFEAAPGSKALVFRDGLTGICMQMPVRVGTAHPFSIFRDKTGRRLCGLPGSCTSSPSQLVEMSRTSRPPPASLPTHSVFFLSFFNLPVPSHVFCTPFFSTVGLIPPGSALRL